MDVTNREDAERIAFQALKNQPKPQPSLWERLSNYSQQDRERLNLECEITETVQQTSIIFAIVFCLCLLYLSHFWLLRGDTLIWFLAALSLVNFLSFYGYVKVKDRF